MKNNRQVPFIITIISIIIGFMLAIQYQSHKTTSMAEKQDVTQLRQDLQKQIEKHQKLLNDIGNYEQLLSEYETSINEGSSLKVVQDQLDHLKSDSGFAEAKGSGIRIMIEEGSPHSAGPDNLQSPVNDEDLLDLTSLLFSNGAKAISINGHRVIVSTSIRLVGDTVQVDTQPIKMPYVVDAIGDPQTLEASLKLPLADGASMEDWFRFLNKRFTQTKSDSMVVPAYNGDNTVQYMKPVDKGAS
ncbi:DUF881 domain-containing protein [Aneurinibacillus sp. Ricciae_BoGa-3]|uniref:DUF881 domain-containing protein n=1 Tax=Aneurinibacillus sp. Ricciae_BoGa-3 TaxID=3022697 RepID=UPI0023411092|nr:DUF881 domain-containing protein [Aneurinibacillus sp. Ricciae_BoGa-3]WCK53080.1 DUF881 domain-containing protein [Aneurinibacillus sp. Ricciae_BoGa-3]